MSTPTLLLKQIQSEIRNFRRNPTAAIFTVIFPLVFLILGQFMTGTTTFEGRSVRYVDVVMPGIVAYGVFSASFTNLAIRITMLRDQGILKRVRSTPVPTWIYLAGHIGCSIVVSIALASLLTLGSWLMYDVQVHLQTSLAFVATIMVGGFAFCAMGLALSGFIPNGDAAPAFVQLAGFPQFILGGVFFAVSQPGVFWSVVRAFPLPHMSHAMKVVFDNSTTGYGFHLNDLLVLMAWGVASTLIAIKKFKWENSLGTRKSPRRRRPVTGLDPVTANRS